MMTWQIGRLSSNTRRVKECFNNSCVRFEVLDFIFPCLLCPQKDVLSNVAGERRPTYDDAAEAEKSLLGGLSAPVAGSAMPYPYGD
jgi:hypothetical protein